MCTYNGYYVTFDENERGSLETGKTADMVILSANPYAIPPQDITSLRVEQLLLGGKPYQSCRESVPRMIARGMVSGKKF